MMEVDVLIQTAAILVGRLDSSEDILCYAVAMSPATASDLASQERQQLSPNKNKNACQPGLGACGASLSSPGRFILSDLIGAGNRQMVNVRQDHVVPNEISHLKLSSRAACTFSLPMPKLARISWHWWQVK